LSDSSGRGLFSSILLTYLILILHGLVIIGLAFLVVFFRGVVEYLPWVVGGGIILILLSAWLIWRKFVQSRNELAEMLNHPALRDREVEIKLMGGLASVKLGQPSMPGGPAEPALDYHPEDVPLELAAPPDPPTQESSAVVETLVAEEDTTSASDLEIEGEVAVEMASDFDAGESQRLRDLARLVKQRERGELDQHEFDRRKEELSRKPLAGSG